MQLEVATQLIIPHIRVTAPNVHGCRRGNLERSSRPYPLHERRHPCLARKQVTAGLALTHKVNTFARAMEIAAKESQRPECGQSIALFAAAVRGEPGELRQVLANLKNIAASFRRSFFCFVVDPDDESGAREIIARWCRGRPSCVVEAHAPELDRTKKLAVLREIARELLSALPDWTEPNAFYIPFDTNGVNMINVAPDLARGVRESFEYAPDGWSAIFPTQRDGYYDIFALRNSTTPYDCWYAPEIKSSERKRYVRERQQNLFNFVDGRTFAPVNSAFGGLGFYRASRLGGAHYSVSDIDHCEHVRFNYGVSGKKYVCSVLVNGSSRHTHHLQ